MSTPSLNDLLPAYKATMANGDFQQAHRALVASVHKLRTGFAKTLGKDFTMAGVMHGYIDYTYFYLQNDYLKQHQLKLAMVLNHPKASFELWLLGQTKDVQRSYWHKLKGTKWVNTDAVPEYAIFETDLLAEPDFDDSEGLMVSITSAFSARSKDIIDTLKAIPE